MLRKRSSRRRIRLGGAAALLCLLLAFLAGCGDDSTGQTTAPAVTGASSSVSQAAAGSGETSAQDEPSADPATDREKIQKTIEGVLGGSDPAAICGSLTTDRYVKQAYGDTAGCKKAQSKKAAAESLKIGDIAISPEAVAQTSVRAKGGVYDGEQLRVVLVLQDGDWRLDSLRSNVPVGP